MPSELVERSESPSQEGVIERDWHFSSQKKQVARLLIFPVKRPRRPESDLMEGWLKLSREAIGNDRW